MPLGRRRRPVARAAALGTVAYQGSKRGAQAAEDEAQAAAPPPPPQQAPPPDAAPEDPTVEKINQLAQLHASGALTDEEFAAAKAKALGIG
jgi:Short C-terminal domain